MLGARGYDINTGRIDRTVTQDVGKLCNVLFDAVEGAGEEFPQIVGKNLRGLHTGGFAQLLHSTPDVAAIQRLSGTGNEDCARCDAMSLGVIQ